MKNTERVLNDDLSPQRNNYIKELDEESNKELQEYCCDDSTFKKATYDSQIAPYQTKHFRSYEGHQEEQNENVELNEQQQLKYNSVKRVQVNPQLYSDQRQRHNSAKSFYKNFSRAENYEPEYFKNNTDFPLQSFSGSPKYESKYEM